LLFNVSTFAKWWVQELNERYTQIVVILKKIDELKISKSISRSHKDMYDMDLEKKRTSSDSHISSHNEDKRNVFDSLLSYDANSFTKIDNSRVSFYELPFKIK
jgi:hypothetical protein